MIEPIADMPPDTFGFRGSGKFTRADYTKVLIPPLRAAVERGETSVQLALRTPLGSLTRRVRISRPRASVRITPT